MCVLLGVTASLAGKRTSQLTTGLQPAMSRRTTGKGFDYVEGSDTSDDHTARVYTVKYPEPESLKDEAKHAWEHRVHK